MKTTTLIAALSAGFSCAVVAQTERDLDSHEHGHALLNVAIDSELLIVELDSPWNNLVGFEHKPGNSEEQSLVDTALADLNDPGKLFGFEGAQCSLVDAMVENSASDEEHHDDHHDEHDEDKHGDDDHHDEEHDEHKHDDEAHHDEEHDEDKHDDDAHHDEEHDEDNHDDDHHDEEHADHDDHDDHDETHSEVRVSYSFECDNINKLEAINVKFFELWAGFEELDAQLIGPSGQAAAELTPDVTRLDVSQVQ